MDKVAVVKVAHCSITMYQICVIMQFECIIQRQKQYWHCAFKMFSCTNLKTIVLNNHRDANLLGTIYVTSSWKTAWWRNTKDQAQTRGHAFSATSDQNLNFLSLMNIYSKHFCHSLCSFNHKYYHKHVKTSDLGLHCLFLHKADFRRWCHKYVYHFFHGSRQGYGNWK